MDNFIVKDANGVVIEKGSKVYLEGDPPYSDEFGTNIGTVMEISDFDGDVDDDTLKSITINPYVTVEWIEFKGGEPIPFTEDYATSAWEFTVTKYDHEDGCPLEQDGVGICDDLLVLTGKPEPRIIDPR